MDQVEIIKRLANDDRNLIEHIARTSLKMIGKDELVFISRESEKEFNSDNQNIKSSDYFRILTDDEFIELLN